MKKLLVTITEYPPMVSGVCTLTECFLQELAADKGYEVTLWAPPGSQPPTNVRLIPTYFRRRPMVPRILVELINGLRLRNILKTDNYDAAFFMDASSRAYGFPFVPEVKSAIYVHGHEVKSEGTVREFTTQKLRLQKNAMHRADIVLANSRATLDRTLGCSPDTHARVVYPCYDPQRVYQPERHQASPFPEGPFHFLTVARVVPRKGHEIILKSLARIGERLNWNYTIVGDGPIRRDLQMLAERLGIASRVRFPGLVPSEELGAYYHHADLMVMLPKPRIGGFEGFGLSYIEASYSGTPSVGSAHGGVMEAIQNDRTGLIVDTSDPDQLAEILLSLVNDPERLARFIQAGRERTVAEFSPAAFAKQILASVSP